MQNQDFQLVWNSKTLQCVRNLFVNVIANMLSGKISGSNSYAECSTLLLIKRHSSLRSQWYLPRIPVGLPLLIQYYTVLLKSLHWPGNWVPFFFRLCMNKGYCSLFHQQQCNFPIPRSKALNLPAAPKAGEFVSTSLCMDSIHWNRVGVALSSATICVCAFTSLSSLLGTWRLRQASSWKQVTEGERADVYICFVLKVIFSSCPRNVGCSCRRQQGIVDESH